MIGSLLKGKIIIVFLQIKKKLKRCQAKVGSENIKSIMINIIYFRNYACFH